MILLMLALAQPMISAPDNPRDNLMALIFGAPVILLFIAVVATGIAGLRR